MRFLTGAKPLRLPSIIMQNKFSLQIRTDPNYGSHLPVLIKLVSMTNGPIAELGCGIHSTPFLHWACFPNRRQLTTFEAVPRWFPFIERFRTDYHNVQPVTDWDIADFSPQWSIAFVDHENSHKRYRELARLTHAEYVVAHDAENSSDHRYGYSAVHKLFKYRWKYTDTGKRHTAVFSNFHDVSKLEI